MLADYETRMSTSPKHDDESAMTGRDYRRSHMTPGKGKAYDARFAENRHRNMVWAIEQQVLLEVLRRYAPRRPLRLLDFACGTGRIVSYLEPHVAEAVGVDISAEMLGVARERVRSAELVESDITQEDVLAGRTFDVVTAFRFFANAQPELRSSVLSVLVRHLEPDGILVFNNHQNSDSSLLRVARFLHRRVGGRILSDREVVEMLRAAGLRVLRTYSVAFLPFSEQRMLLPAPIILPLERCLTALPMPHCVASLAQNRIYVTALASDGARIADRHV